MDNPELNETGKLLGRSDEAFRLLVEGVKDYAIFMLDTDGRIATWNAGAERIKGYKAEEIIGRHFSCFYPPEALAQRWPEHELRIARIEERFEDEGWRLRKDGSRFWANVVITALWDRTGELRGYAKVTRDMTERRRVAELEETSRRMNEFLAMLAHELRGPLAPIRNAVGVLRSENAVVEDLQRCRDIIDRQVSHLSNLVDDLLDAGRVTLGKMVLHCEPVELSQVAASAVETSRPLIDAAQHALAIDLPAEPLIVQGDLARLAQVVVNLLDNAAKYTPEGGQIRLAIAREGAEAVIRVRDTGTGVPEYLKPRIFGLFVQGDRTLDRAGGGLGVGLALARSIVTMHGGSIEVVSEGAGKGSEFIVRLPYGSMPAQATSDQAPARAPAAPPSRRRVLVVDDNRDTLESMGMLVELWGHEVRCAKDGPAALTLAEQFQPEIVLLDIGLPGMNGCEAARRLRQVRGLEHAVMIALTGYGREDDRQVTRAAGFDHHVVKPVNPPKLRALITSHAPRHDGSDPTGSTCMAPARKPRTAASGRPGLDQTVTG